MFMRVLLQQMTITRTRVPHTRSIYWTSCTSSGRRSPRGQRATRNQTSGASWSNVSTWFLVFSPNEQSELLCCRVSRL